MNAQRVHQRRRFLRGAGLLGATALAAPLLPSLARGATSPFPRRLVVFFSGNGTIHGNWLPSAQGGMIAKLSPILAPLEPFLRDLIVVDGMHIAAGEGKHQPRQGFHGHERGLGAILTGTHLNVGTMEAMSGYANGISVDQFIANRIRAEGALHSLQVGLISRRHSNGWYNRDTMTYAGANDPRFAESDGSRLFTTIFGDAKTGADDFKRAQERRASVLDFLKDDLARVEARISVADRRRLAQHTETFRELEKQLAQPAPTCEAAAAPTIRSWTDENNMTAISDFQLRQTVQALACDRTRVATIQYGGGLGALSLRPIGSTNHWHEVSHEGDDNTQARDLLTDINTYIAGRFAKLLGFMKEIPEGDGTLLDHSVVLWVNELGKGNNHSYQKAPLVIAGNLHGTFRTGGRLITYQSRPNNDLLVTLCQAFGLDVNTFGKQGLTTGPMTELLA